MKTVRKSRVIPRSRIPLETWLAELRRTTALTDLGAVFLSLQISELENKCAAVRRQMQHKGNMKPVIPLKSARYVRRRNSPQGQRNAAGLINTDEIAVGEENALLKSVFIGGVIQ